MTCCKLWEMPSACIFFTCVMPSLHPSATSASFAGCTCCEASRARCVEQGHMPPALKLGPAIFFEAGIQSFVLSAEVWRSQRRRGAAAARETARLVNRVLDRRRPARTHSQALRKEPPHERQRQRQVAIAMLLMLRGRREALRHRNKACVAVGGPRKIPAKECADEPRPAQGLLGNALHSYVLRHHHVHGEK